MIKIIEDGFEFLMEDGLYDGNTCEGCPAYKKCKDGSATHAMCYNAETHHCTSATKIEDELKIYNQWQKEGSKHLVGKEVLYYFVDVGFGSRWRKAVFIKFNDALNTFMVRVNGEYENVYVIREIKPETITLTEARERFNIPANIIIEGE